MRKELDDPRLSRALSGALLVIAAVMLIQTFGKAHRAGGYDFASYLRSASALVGGTDPYHTGTPFPYIYPLFLAFALIPLTFVPYDAAVAVWFVLGAACLCGTARLVARLTDAEKATWPSTALTTALLALAGLLDAVQIDLLNGQVNIEVLLLCVLFFDRYRKRQWGLAAVFLAAAIAIKLVPILLLLFLIARREIRTAALTLALAAMFCLLPMVLTGRALFTYYGSYAREFLLSRLAHPAAAGAIGFTPDHFLARIVPGPIAHYAVVAAIVALLAWTARRGRDDRSKLAAFCAFLVAMPLLSPMSEVHHLVLAVPAGIVLSHAALEIGGTIRVSAIAFWCCLWLGRVDRTGPFYFLALAALMVGLLSLQREPTRAASS